MAESETVTPAIVIKIVIMREAEIMVFFMENTSVYFFICYIYYQTPVKKKQDDFSGKMQNLAGLCQKSCLVYVRSYIYNLFVSLYQSC